MLLALAASRRGAEVELWTARMSVPVPATLTRRTFRTVSELMTMVSSVDHDAVIVPASLSDYAPRAREGKIPSGQEDLEIPMCPLPKVLPALRPRTRALVGFKAEIEVTPDELVRRARSRLDEHRLDLVVANDLRDVGPGQTKAVLVTVDGETPFEGPKSTLADRILDVVVKVLR